MTSAKKKQTNNKKESKSDNKSTSSSLFPSRGLFLFLVVLLGVSYSLIPLVRYRLDPLVSFISKKCVEQGIQQCKRPEAVGPHFTFENIWNTAELNDLYKLIRDSRIYASFIRDQTSAVESVGESTPLLPDGTCPHRYLVPNSKRTSCILPARIDVGHHYVMTGGPGAYKQPFDQLVKRTMSFSHFYINGDNNRTHIEDLPAMKSLFQSPSYLSHSNEVCNGYSTLQPFQLGIILQLPGQQLGNHYDVPWFWGADRLKLPQWLLAVMQGSGLFASRRLPQVQGVAYLHKNVVGDGGEFIYYPYAGSNPSFFAPLHNTGIILDGSQMAHGSLPFRPSKDELFQIPLATSSQSEMRYNDKTNQFDMFVTSPSEKLIKSYDFDDVRISLVWRSLCFKDAAERDRYNDPVSNPPLELQEVMDQLINDLHKRKITNFDAEAYKKNPQLMSTIDLALLMIKTYVDYPLPHTSLIPINYCVIPGAVGDLVRKYLC